MSFNERADRTNPDVRDILAKTQNNQTWHILPPAKYDPSKPGAYSFTPSMQSFEKECPVSQRDAFGKLLGDFTRAKEFNPHVEALGKTRQRDETYPDGTRATYMCADLRQNRYEEKPSAVITKKRLFDLNIKSASVPSGPLPTMSADLRISCSTETASKVPQNQRVKLTRIKERTSFKFNWMRLDMTVTQSSNKGKSELDYEVELEICDVNYLMGYVGDEIAFRSIIRRFLQNAAMLTKFLAHGRRELR